MIVLDTQGLFAGQITLGQSSWGVLGSEVPSSGGSGASPMYNNLSLPADANTQFLLIQETQPSAGTVTWNDYGAFTFSGAPDGFYSFTARFRSPGQDLGLETISMSVGATAGIVNLSSGIASSEAFGSPSVAGYRIGTVVGQGIGSAEAFGSPSVNGYKAGSVSSQGVASSEAFGVPTVVGRTSALISFNNGIASQEAFGAIGVSGVQGVSVVVMGGIASQEAFGSASFIPVSTGGGLDPFSPIGKIRLKVGDYSDLPILPDSVIYAALSECNGNINRASSLCAQYILGALTAKTHKRLSQLETWSGEQFTNYVKFLQMTVLNPHLTGVAPVPYAGKVEEDPAPIKTFIDGWQAGYLPGSFVIPPQKPGKVIEYAFS